MGGQTSGSDYRVQNVPTMSEYQKWFVDNALGGLANMLQGGMWMQPYGGPNPGSFDPRAFEFTKRKPNYQSWWSSGEEDHGSEDEDKSNRRRGRDDIDPGGDRGGDDGRGGDEGRGNRGFWPQGTATQPGMGTQGGIDPMVFAQMMMGGGGMQSGGGMSPMGTQGAMPQMGTQGGMPYQMNPWTPGMTMPQNPFTQTYTNPYVDPFRQGMTGNYPG